MHMIKNLPDARSTRTTPEVGRNLGLDEVVDHFTLVGDELTGRFSEWGPLVLPLIENRHSSFAKAKPELVLLRNPSGATRLGPTAKSSST
jgi:hypothetical protein